jgi:hypothetical protein
LIPIALAVFLSVHTRKMQAEQTKPFGVYNAQQVLSMAERLCQKLAPEKGDLRLSVDQNVAMEPGGVQRREWEVDCLDKTGTNVFEFDWDADTGELIQVLGFLPFSLSKEHTPLEREAAVFTARQWLHTLGMARDESQWQAEPAPKLSGTLWIVRWQARDRTVILQIDRYSGELQAARKRRLSPLAAREPSSVRKP